MNSFGFKSKEGEVFNHWIAFVDGFSYPPQQFYDAVESEIAARQIPGLDMWRVAFAEGGLLSDKRVYLRIHRERLVFDTCAAPLGDGYFFSCRSVYLPPVIELWQVVLIVLSFGIIGWLLSSLVGPWNAPIAFVGLLIAVVQVFRNTIALGLSDLDSVLVKTPIIGPFYDRFFRKETYFRQDTRLMYLDAVPKLVEKLASQLTATKGVKLVRQYQCMPVLGELYKPHPQSVQLRLKS